MVDKIPVSEKDLSSFVEDALNTFGWRWCHFRPARTEKGWRTAITGHKGFLDYLCLKGERLVVIELKSEKGKMSPEQQEWWDAWVASYRCELYLWRPSDWQEIVEVLR